ncbi:MAG TPA: EamA family transporter, partial [Oligoflexia bacterium]|nr:EamA family transporter [Oligoflexia bacterium]
ELMVEKIPILGEGDIIKQYALLLFAAGITPTFFYFVGLKYTRATAGAFCEMIQAIVAVLVAWIVLGDALAWHQIIAAVVLVVSVTMINLLQARDKS